MQHNASSTRTATTRSAGRPAQRPGESPVLRWTLTHPQAARALRRVVAASLLAIPLFLFLPCANAQFNAPSDLGMTFTQQRSKFVGDSASDSFYLRGATVDYGDALWHGLGAAVSLNGLSVTNLRGQIDIHQASFLGGGRYTYSLGHITPTVWNRKGSIFAEGLAGYTIATAGYYPVGNRLVSNSSGLSYALGGGINYNVYHDLELRLMAHYVITDLPNGGTDQQRNLQVSLGVNWHFGN